ncbi:hypothetical protein [Micromonospora sp. LOL_015]|uniref:hypothetical protein n=1 Tax=Micromonospora sp. LOL_015 TaxID=3345416 RepID=UPI003A8BBBB8
MAAFCPPFTTALAVLDRWDQVKARRVRAVLQYAGLWPDGYVHDGRDGRMAAIGVYKSALTRPGVLRRHRPPNGADPFPAAHP